MDDFQFGSHPGSVRQGDDVESVIAFKSLYFILKLIRDSKITLEACKDTKYYEIKDGRIPDGVVFRPEELHAMIWVGTPPSSEDLNEAGLVNLAGRA